MANNLTPNESILLDQVHFGGLHHFAAVYAPIHEPLVLIICELPTGYCRTFAGLMGIPCHIACMITLSGRRLFSATSATLISLSLSQLLLILMYIFVTTLRYFTEKHYHPSLESYMWMTLLLVNVNAQVVMHTIAVWHVVCISIVRYIAIGYFVQSVSQRTWFSVRRAMFMCIGIYMTVIFVCTPFYMSSVVAEKGGRTIFGVPLKTFNFWMFAIVGKLLPCFLLLIMSALLVHKLHELQVRAELLSQQSSKPKSLRNYRRTTHMILAVMILFVIIELPQGVMGLLCGLIGDEFRLNVYYQLSDVSEFLTVLYSCINFLLFAFMNGEFRRQLLHNTRLSLSYVGINLQIGRTPSRNRRQSARLTRTIRDRVLYKQSAVTVPDMSATAVQTTCLHDGEEDDGERGRLFDEEMADDNLNSLYSSSTNVSITQPEKKRSTRSSNAHRMSVAYTMTSAAADNAAKIL